MFKIGNIPSESRYERLDKQMKVVNILKEESVKLGVPLDSEDGKKELELKLKQLGVFKKIVESNPTLLQWYGPQE